MNPSFQYRSKLAFAFLVLSSFLPIISSQSQDVGQLFTCCNLQGALNSEAGTCDQPRGEFDIVFFDKSWTVYPYFRSSVDHSFLNFTLKSRNCNVCKEPYKLYRNLAMPLNTLRRKADSSTQSPILINPTGTLTVQGYGDFQPQHYCFNRLEYLRAGEDEAVAIDIIHCSNVCGTFLTEYATDFSDESQYQKPEVGQTCSDGRQKAYGNCSRTTLQKKNDHFLIYLAENSTPVEDQTYPWKSISQSFFCEESPSKDIVYRKYCLPELKNSYYYFQKIYAILAGVSGIFVLFNLGIYFALRDSLSISGWTEFMYSLSLYLYFVFAIPGLLIVPDNADVSKSCYIISIFMQFFEIGNGATLVALSCDILFTFWKYDKQGYSDDPRVTKIRLIFYFLLSLAVPTGMVTYGVLKNQKKINGLNDFGSPQYGLLHCTSPAWIMSTYAQFGMQSLNLLLVLISAYIILNKRVVRQDFGVLQEVLIELNPDRMDIFSKLFVFVFIFWTIDFMELILSKEIFTDEWHGVAFQVINYSQGVSAFFILVFNRQTLRACGEKNWSLKQMFQHACTCGSGNNFEDEDLKDLGESQMSPFMKTGTIQSYKRSTVRDNSVY